MAISAHGHGWIIIIMEIYSPPTKCDLSDFDWYLLYAGIIHASHCQVSWHLLTENTVSETWQRIYDYEVNNASIDRRARERSKKLLMFLSLRLLQGLLCTNKSSTFLKKIQSTLNCCCGLFISSNISEYTFIVFQTWNSLHRTQIQEHHLSNGCKGPDTAGNMWRILQSVIHEHCR